MQVRFSPKEEFLRLCIAERRERWNTTKSICGVLRAHVVRPTLALATSFSSPPLLFGDRESSVLSPGFPQLGCWRMTKLACEHTTSLLLPDIRVLRVCPSRMVQSKESTSAAAEGQALIGFPDVGTALSLSFMTPRYCLRP